MGPSSFLVNDRQGKEGEHNARDASQRGGAAIGTAGIGRLLQHGYLVVCLKILCRTQAQAIMSPFMQETTN
jgi:hypothetical protein